MDKTIRPERSGESREILSQINPGKIWLQLRDGQHGPTMGARAFWLNARGGRANSNGREARFSVPINSGIVKVTSSPPAVLRQFDRTRLDPLDWIFFRSMKIDRDIIINS